MSKEQKAAAIRAVYLMYAKLVDENAQSVLRAVRAHATDKTVDIEAAHLLFDATRIASRAALVATLDAIHAEYAAAMPGGSE